ncbi:MAG TPA: biopolymer transporter ExbD [Myxococcota bacterium]|nr:biopolymer transporter ExbD [Myxococcota bacterium]
MRRRRRRERMATDPPEINLVPLLDMVSLLIQMMLINAQFGLFAEVPSMTAVAAEGKMEGEPLALAVHVERDGFRLTWSEGGSRQALMLPCAEKPCATPDAWDRAGLARAAGELKGRHPGEQKVALMPGEGVPFEIVIGAMDTLREGPSAGEAHTELFPDVLFPGARR